VLIRRSEEQLEAERAGDDGAEDDDDERGRAAEGEADLVGGVHPEVAQARAEVQQVGPDQGEGDELPPPARQPRGAGRKDGGELLVRDLRGHAGVEHPNRERQEDKHRRAADAMQDRDPAGGRQAVRRQVGDMDVAIDRLPLQRLFFEGGDHVDREFRARAGQPVDIIATQQTLPRPLPEKP
jgi:hypothetical protein